MIALTKRSSHYGFVITLLWIGMLFAISFLEAPLKFQAPSLTLAVGLEIGHLVFHALNKIEIVFAVLLALCALWGTRSTAIVWLSVACIGGLLLQTLLLYTVLDARTLAIINGETVPAAPYHLYYIALEVLKVALLLGLTKAQLRSYASAIRQGLL